MKILVLGAGAIGGYFGGRLLENGADVTFLVRAARKRLLEENGLRMTSQYGDYSAPVRAITQEEIAHPWDVVLVTCKAYDLDSVMEAIAPAVGPHTAVLPLLNGIAHMERLNARFGREKVLGGLAKIVAALGSDGVIRHMNDWNSITFGEQDGRMSERVKSLQALFPAASVKAAAVADIQQKMWEKVVHLATVAGIATLMRGSVGEIAGAPGGTALLTEFLHRNAEVAGREGYPISQGFLQEYLALFADQSSPYVPSLLRDIEKGGRNEGQHILGHMLKLVQQHGLDDALHALVCMHINVYDQRLASGRLV